MAYTKTVWQDHIVSTPNTYALTPNGGNKYTIIPDGGTILQEGTPVNAANLNKIEDELEALDSGKVSLTGDIMTGPLTMLNSTFNIRATGGAWVTAVRDTNGNMRTLQGIAGNNSFYFRTYVTTGGSVTEDYLLPSPNTSLTSSTSMNIVVDRLIGTTSSSASTSFTLPKSGRWLIVTSHASTDALCGVWVAVTTGNKIINIGGGANISFSLSGTTLTASATTGGGASVFGIFLG